MKNYLNKAIERAKKDKDFRGLEKLKRKAKTVRFKQKELIFDAKGRTIKE